jgi:hypothetical protein
VTGEKRFGHIGDADGGKPLGQFLLNVHSPVMHGANPFTWAELVIAQNASLMP